MARRAASIWRSVTRAASMAFSPYSPKLRAAPRVAIPAREPRCCFRYLTRLGASMLRASQGGASGPGTGGAPGPAALLPRGGLHGRRGRVGEPLTAEDPCLDPDHPVGGVGLGIAVVDVRAQRVQGHPALAVPLAARDLGPAQPPGA